MLCVKEGLAWAENAEAGVLKKLSLAGLAKLSSLRYSFGLASAGYHRLGVHDRPVYTAG